MRYLNQRILVISDLHLPYAHRDLLPFLTAVKERYKPTRVVLTGDEVDKHGMSFHDSDPDLYSAGHELDRANEQLRPVYGLFPVADILESNHGSLLYRKALHHGIPRKYLRPYNEVLDAPAGWVWHKNLILRSGAQDIFFTHGLCKDSIKLVHRTGMCTVQGHFHTEFHIRHTATYLGQVRWGMIAGCLIDDEALAFRYNKQHVERPILGVGTITAGIPSLIPMRLDANKRWDGQLSGVLR